MIKFWDPRTGTVLSTVYVLQIITNPIFLPGPRHYHKNTIQALAWSPDGNFVASASRDQTVRVFDIRAMKEFRVLKGHKKEVCCMSLSMYAIYCSNLFHLQRLPGTRFIH